MLQWEDVNEVRQFFESKVKLLQLFSSNPSVQEEIFGGHESEDITAISNILIFFSKMN